ncbi:MAG: hypothetical protein PHU32_03410 [Candidatus ainarchaeum sp.]|nr:hypothetical protein [Candidatus ainarchaeum sp.]
MFKKYILLLFSIILISSALFAGASSTTADIPLVFKFKGEFIDNVDDITFTSATVTFNSVQIAFTNDNDEFLEGFFSDVVNNIPKNEKYLDLEYRIKIIDNSVEGFGVAENLSYNFKILNPYFSELGAVSFNYIDNDSVTSENIINDTIKVNKIALRSVTNSKIKDDAINGKLSMISTSKIANNSITNTHIQNSSISPDKLNSVQVNLESLVSINSEGALATKAYNFGGGPKIVALEGLGLSNSVLSVVSSGVKAKHIKSKNITTPKIDVSAVTGHKIANSAITTNKIIDSSVSTDKVLNSSIATSKIKDFDVGLEKLDDKIIKSTYCVNKKIEIGPVIENGTFIIDSTTLNINDSCFVNRDDPTKISITFDVSNISANYAYQGIYLFNESDDLKLTSRWFCSKLGGYMSDFTEVSKSYANGLAYTFNKGNNKNYTFDYVYSDDSKNYLETVTCVFEEIYS